MGSDCGEDKRQGSLKPHPKDGHSGQAVAMETGKPGGGKVTDCCKRAWTSEPGFSAVSLGGAISLSAHHVWGTTRLKWSFKNALLMMEVIFQICFFFHTLKPFGDKDSQLEE